MSQDFDEMEYRQNHLEEMSLDDLERWADYLFERHQEVTDANPGYHSKQLDEMAKEHMKKIRAVEKEIERRT